MPLNIRQQLSLSLSLSFSPSILQTNSTIWHLHVSNIWYRDIRIAVIAPTSLEAETPNCLVKVKIESFISSSKSRDFISLYFDICLLNDQI